MAANLDTKWGNKGAWISKLEPSSTIYSWVMNNHWITNFPLTQDGPVTFRYRILLHGKYNVADANRFGLEQSQPLVHVTANNDPKINPLVVVNNDLVYVTIIKTLADSKEKILRLRSLSDKSEMVTLSFPGGVPESINNCPVGEESRDQISTTFSMLPYGMKTLRLQF